MAYALSEDTEIHISTTEAGTYTLIAGGHTMNDRRGAQGGESYKLFGTDTKLVEAGSDDSTFSLNYLLDLADTLGQDVIRAAFENKTVVWLRILYDGENGRQQSFTVTANEVTSDANGTGLGRYVQGTAEFTSAGPSVDVVAAP